MMISREQGFGKGRKKHRFKVLLFSLAVKYV